MTLLWTLLFFSAVVGLYLLPFVPAIREIRLRRDDAPLAVQGDYRVDARHFAHRFRDRVRGAMGPLLAKNPPPGIGEEVEFEGEPTAVLAHGDTLRGETPGGGDERLILGAGDLTVSAGRVQRREVYATGALRIGNGTRCRALLAEGQLDLAADAEVLRWAHAGGMLYAEAGAHLFGRASSDAEISLASGCRFERLHAPRIVARASRPAVEPPAATSWRLLDPEKLHPRVEFRGGRALIDGDLEIPERSLLEFDLVVLGRLKVGDGCRISGRVKARRELRLGAHCRARSLVSERDLVVGASSIVRGPVLAEGLIRLESEATVGAPDRLTTVRGERVLLAEGSTVHGTVWASQGGEVVA